MQGANHGLDNDLACPDLEYTELGVLTEPEVGLGETEVCEGV